MVVGVAEQYDGAAVEVRIEFVLVPRSCDDAVVKVLISDVPDLEVVDVACPGVVDVKGITEVGLATKVVDGDAAEEEREEKIEEETVLKELLGGVTLLDCCCPGEEEVVVGEELGVPGLDSVEVVDTAAV